MSFATLPCGIRKQFISTLPPTFVYNLVVPTWNSKGVSYVSVWMLCLFLCHLFGGIVFWCNPAWCTVWPSRLGMVLRAGGSVYSFLPSCFSSQVVNVGWSSDQRSSRQLRRFITQKLHKCRDGWPEDWCFLAKKVFFFVLVWTPLDYLIIKPQIGY